MISAGSDQLLTGLQFPYVGAPVASACLGTLSSAPIDMSSTSPTFQEETPSHVAPHRYNSPLCATPTCEIGPKWTLDGERSKCKDKHKKTPYPNIGIHVRNCQRILNANDKATRVGKIYPVNSKSYGNPTAFPCIHPSPS